MSRTRAVAAALAALLLAGCFTMPVGEPVYVDSRAGRFYSGEGVLLEVSDSQEHCRIAARERSLLVTEKWVLCRYVHRRHLPPDRGPRG